MSFVILLSISGDHISIYVLKETIATAESVNGVIPAIDTDKGSQFYANKKGKKRKGKSQSQEYLEKKGTESTEYLT